MILSFYLFILLFFYPSMLLSFYPSILLSFYPSTLLSLYFYTLILILLFLIFQSISNLFLMYLLLSLLCNFPFLNIFQKSFLIRHFIILSPQVKRSYYSLSKICLYIYAGLVKKSDISIAL